MVKIRLKRIGKKKASICRSSWTTSIYQSKQRPKNNSHDESDHHGYIHLQISHKAGVKSSF